MRDFKGVSRKDDDFSDDAQINATYSSNMVLDISNDSRRSDRICTNLRMVSTEHGKTCVIFCEREQSSATG